MPRTGKNVIYIPGNHDEFLREFHEFDLSLGNLKVVNKYEYETVRGERYLLVHGDAFDVVTRYHKWIALLGDVAYDFLLWLNRHFNSIRQMLGFQYWSLSKFIKQKTKQAVSFIGAFEDVASRSAKRYDGIMCGHIHKASLKQFDHFLYMNTGDWVESCTAIIEYLDGSFALIEYQEGVYVILEEW